MQILEGEFFASDRSDSPRLPLRFKTLRIKGACMTCCSPSITTSSQKLYQCPLGKVSCRDRPPSSTIGQSSSTSHNINCKRSGDAEKMQNTRILNQTIKEMSILDSRIYDLAVTAP
jgi:hypothetical protein